MTRTRSIGLAVAAVALALAGCGGGEAEVPAAAPTPPPVPAATPELPDETGPELREPAEVRRRLRGGEVGVIDLANRSSVEPARLLANKEQVLSGMAWKGWGSRRTVGRGTVETLDCQPTCGRGLVSESRATLTLTDVRVCGSRRYYAEAQLVYRDVLQERERESAVYLRPPC